MRRAEVIKKGDASGNGMVFKTTSQSGLELFGLATENFYGGDWDLGPTWNYLVMANEPFLVDTGRTGTCALLLEMIECTGLPIRDLKTVVLSHGHEDHDGGMPEIVQKSGARVLAHPIYEKLIRLEPEKAPEGISTNFPPSCWHCPMPDSFVDKNCRKYHLNRNELTVDNICEAGSSLGDNTRIMYLPGHSPDAIGIIIDQDFAIVGDNVLPHISPSPTKRESYDLVSPVFPGNNPQIQEAFGLEAYIRSLKSLQQVGVANPGILTLPGHRLYYDDQWNNFRLEDRTAEIIDHHIERCGDIMNILKESPKTIREVMTAHFEPSLLEGMGVEMAKNEIQSHLELLSACSDIRKTEERHYTHLGSSHFESHIQALEPWTGY